MSRAIILDSVQCMCHVGNCIVGSVYPLTHSIILDVGITVASSLVHLSLERAVQVRALAGDTVVFLGKTLNSHSASLPPPRCINGYW